MSESRQLTPRRTPAQGRSYLSANSHGFHQHSPHHYSGTGSVHAINETHELRSQQSNMIYGTNISTHQVYNQLESFVSNFEQHDSMTQTTESIYMTQLSEMDYLQTNIFNVSAMDLKQYDDELYYQFIYFPAEMIVCFDQVIQQMFSRLFIANCNDPHQLMKKTEKRDKIMVAIKNLGNIKVMRDIKTNEVNRLISFRGIVVRTSDIIPQMKKAFFKCVICQKCSMVQLENAKVSEPKACQKCFTKNSFEIVHNLSQFTDKQYIKFQQIPEYVPEGETPHAITVIAYDFNVDTVKPGDRVEVTGIFRAQQQKITRNKSQVAAVFKTHLDLISYQIVDENRLKVGVKALSFNDKDKEQFFKMSSNPKIIQNLVRSFAPSIHGHLSIKKGILAQLFGGAKKIEKNQRTGEETVLSRADINICLVGDPSTAKSQLLQQVYKIAPRGIYTSGRGSSAVGLTANVKRDPETKQFILQSGALVLSDQGICCIDEFDKMDKNNKTILLEGMEQQTISIAKAGIVCQLNCRTAIISAANPVHSRYNPKKSVVQNINLPPALLSRFDLIYLMLDKHNEIQDTEIAQHLLNLFSCHDSEKQKIEAEKKIVYSRDLLTKYISYAREYIEPKLSEKACNLLANTYVQMRKIGSSTKTITATPRQLESLIRLSEAFAKMKLSSSVEESDVLEAAELIKIAIQQAATDPETGRIDMDTIVTGKTSASRQKIQKIVEIIKQILKANSQRYKKRGQFSTMLKDVDVRFQSTEKQSVIENQLLEALRILEAEGELALFGGDKSKPSFKTVKDRN